MIGPYWEIDLENQNYLIAADSNQSTIRIRIDLIQFVY